jgi:predicted nuclease with TOPRIM domain
VFFDHRKAHFEERDREFALKAEAKTALIQIATAIASSKDYSNANADKMKDLDRQWKEIGFCGKGNERKLWQSFSEAKEDFWEGRRQYFEQRKTERRARLQEAITRKQGQISDLHGQIEHLEDKMEYVMNQDHIDNMCRWIDEKKEKIQKLEADISDIESKL